MSRLEEAIHGMHQLDYLAARRSWINQVHPTVKICVTILYIFLVVSFDKYNLTGLAGMCLYPVILMSLADLSLLKSLKQNRELFLIVAAVGIANPFLDRTIVAHWNGIAISGGVLSMVTLMLKGIFALLASHLLIATTSMENICYGLRKMCMPQILVTVIMLIYRYIILFMKEVERIGQAYAMRAPGQKGIHYKVWGTLTGQLLLRSMDRAENVYESMELRGFHGEFQLRGSIGSRNVSACYGVCCLAGILLLRFVPVFELVGNLLIR